MALNRIEDWDDILDPPKSNSSEIKTPSNGTLDREAAAQAALEGKEWHNNELKLVASFVSKGLSDDEIYLLTEPLKLEGYTIEETRAEIQEMIDGARKKGFGPPNNDHKEPLLQHIADIELKPTEWLIDGVFEEKSLTQIFGKSGSGKSFVAIDASCAIASGKAFHGRSVVSGPVIYIAGEGRNGTIRRISAWAKNNSIKLSDINIYVSRTAVGIQNDTELVELKNRLKDIVLEFGNPKLIVLDTLARNFGNANENDTKEMSNFVSEVDRLKDQFNCTILIVHHSGHMDRNRGRGSSVLHGALDSEYKISKTEDRIKMSCTKMKDDTEPDPMHFYLIPYEVKKYKNGIPIHSAILEYRGEGVTESAKLNNSEKFAVDTFNEAVANLDKPPLDLNAPKLDKKEWREVFFKRSTQPKASSTKRVFNKAVESLQAKGWLTVDENICTLIPRDIGT